MLLDISRGDEGLHDTPAESDDRYWVVLVQEEGGYLAEVMIRPDVTFEDLAGNGRTSQRG